MKNKIIVFLILVIIFITSLHAISTLNVQSNTLSFSEKNIVTIERLFTGHLTYVRVFRDGKWWIYVYDGVLLLEVYPE